MTIYFKQCKEQLLSLQNVLNNLSTELYSKPSLYLHNATIGQHTRHIIEMIQCVFKGYAINEIDYINRNRNLQFETDMLFVSKEIDSIINELEMPNKPLKIKLTEVNNTIIQFIDTNYEREIVYVTEHTIHHLALIKVAFIEFNIEIKNPYFGTAYSTIQYKTAQK